MADFGSFAIGLLGGVVITTALFLNSRNLQEWIKKKIKEYEEKRELKAKIERQYKIRILNWSVEKER